MNLIKYDAACRALAEAKQVDEVKAIKDKAEALRSYARQIKNPQLEADAWEIRKRAENRLGELSAALEKDERARTDLRPAGGTQTKTAALKEVGISTSAANRYEHFSQLPEAEKERRIARGRAAIKAGKSIADTIIRQDAKRERREEREVELAARIAALPDERFGVIVADPEWHWEPYSRETGMDRAAANHYPTSALAAIKGRDVPSIAAPDCVLFLWATVPLLPQALEVMAAWGFEYRSHLIWDKLRIGTGYWVRNRHELLLIGVKGEVPAPAPGMQPESVIAIKPGRHSEKPEVFLEVIEQLFPTLPKIELNRRGKPREGWSGWGQEFEGS